MNTRILLVDGAEVIRAGLRAIISDQDDMQVVESLASADLDVIKNEVESLAPDVVVINAPVYGSPELAPIAEAIHRAHDNTKIVIISALHEPDATIWNCRPGIVACISVQTAPDEILAVIRKVVNEEIEVPPAYSRPTPALETDELTPRERQVLGLMASGRNTKEIALILGVSAKTVETHRLNLMNKLHSHSVADLTKLAIREGLASLDTK